MTAELRGMYRSRGERTPTARREVCQVLASLVATAVFPVNTFAAASDTYDRSLVIDALSLFGRDLGEDNVAAVKAAGYSGVFDSLPNTDLQTAIDALIIWRRRADEHADKLLIATRAADFKRAKDSNRTAVLMNFQNATMLEGEADNVEALHALGMRSFQLTYNFRNRLGDGCLERTNAGLSDFGVEVVERMNKVGVMIDLSHCGPQTTFDGIEFSSKPVAITHTMCAALRPDSHPRAKTDRQMKACADKGGVIGMAALGYFVGPDPGGATTIETYADHIEHAASVVGYEHIGLSTDFAPKGIAAWATRENWYEPRLKIFKPSYNVRWPPWIPELDTPDRFRNLLAVLDRRGWSESQIERLLGLNWLRLLQETIG